MMKFAPLLLVSVCVIVSSSIIPVFASHDGSNPPKENIRTEPFRYYIIYVAMERDCGEYDEQILSFFRALIPPYLHKYGFYYITEKAECINAKGHFVYGDDPTQYGLDELAKAVKRGEDWGRDLTVIVFDRKSGDEYTRAFFEKFQELYEGHYYYINYEHIVTKSTFGYKGESDQNAFVLSEELSHFVLRYLGYPEEIWGDLADTSYVHANRLKYLECKKNHDLNSAECSKTWTTIEGSKLRSDGTGYYVATFRVLAPYDKSVSDAWKAQQPTTNPNLNDIDRLTVKELKIYSPYDVDSNKFLPGTDIAFDVVVFNNHAKKQSVAVIQQIQDSNGKTVKNSWITISINSRELVQAQFYWTPKTSGTYTTTFFFWESVDDSTSVAYPTTASFQVYEKSIPTTPKQTTPKQTTPKEEPKLYTSGIPSNSGFTSESADSRKSNHWGKVDRVEAKLVELRAIYQYDNVNSEGKEKIKTAIQKLEGFEGSLENLKELLHVADNFANRGEYEKASMIYDQNIGMINNVVYHQFEDVQSSVFEAMNAEGSYLIQEGEIPEWIKNNAKWWSEGSIDDSDFINGIQHMIQEKIIDIPNMPEQRYITQDKVPKWIKNQAEWWAKGLISEDEFLASIEYLVSNGIIQTK